MLRHNKTFVRDVYDIKAMSHFIGRQSNFWSNNKLRKVMFVNSPSDIDRIFMSIIELITSYL
jgi:hypothetical protein